MQDTGDRSQFFSGPTGENCQKTKTTINNDQTQMQNFIDVSNVGEK